MSGNKIERNSIGRRIRSNGSFYFSERHLSGGKPFPETFPGHSGLWLILYRQMGCFDCGKPDSYQEWLMSEFYCCCCVASYVFPLESTKINGAIYEYSDDDIPAFIGPFTA